MSDRLGELETELHALRAAFETLDSRVRRLEGAADEAAALVVEREEVAREAAPPPADTRELEVPAARMSGVEAEVVDGEAAAPRARIGAGYLGGILLVLAGAYLLRALTEGGALPQVLGVAVGLAYAFAWSLIGYVMGRRDDRGAAAANGIATALISIPLIWEATARFEVLPHPVGAALLAAVVVVLLPLAARYRLFLVAAATVVGVGAASILLMFGTRDPVPFAATLLVLGLAGALIGGRAGSLIPWTAYLLTDAGMALLVLDAIGERAFAAPAPAIVVLVLFAAGFLGLFVRQSLKRGDVGLDEPIQGTLATFLGYGGALLVATSELPAVAPALSAAGLVIGAAGYATLLIALDWTRGHRWPFLLYSTLSLTLVALGAAVFFPQPAWVFAGLAVVLAVIGLWLDRVSPGLHAAAALVLAALSGGLALAVRDSLLAPGTSAWPAPSTTAFATLAAALICAFLPLKVDSPVWPRWLPRFGRTVVALVAALGVDAVIVRLLVPAVAGTPGGDIDEGALAALRTGVLAVTTVVLAWVSRWPVLRPAAWLVYPLLTLTGLKLLLEDFPRGRAITMAIALLLYGGAMILAPRLTRPRDSDEEDEESD